jgi:hypothetical protein
MPAVDLLAFVVQRLDRLIRLGRGFAHIADSLADKQEIFGIDVASLNETAGLFGASAWIRRIHLTETARCAHYVLPAASQYEKWEYTFFTFEFPTTYFHLARRDRARPALQNAGTGLA